MKKVLERLHPNFLELANVVKNKEATTRMKIASYKSDTRLLPRRTFKKKRQQTLWECLNNEHCSIKNYLEAMKPVNLILNGV